MIVAMMPGSAKAVFRERIEEYKAMVEELTKYEEAHKKFAEEECTLYYGDWTEEDPKNAKVKYCHSSCHPDGYGERRECNILSCTWHKKESHGKEKRF